MLVSNNLFKIREFNNPDLMGSQDSFFVARCLLDVIEYLRTNIKQPGRFSLLTNAHAIRLTLSCLNKLSRQDIINRLKDEILATYKYLHLNKSETPPYYGDDFWDWAYILKAFKVVQDIFKDELSGRDDDINLEDEVITFYDTIKAKLDDGLSYNNKGEWYGPATATACHTVLQEFKDYLSKDFEWHTVLGCLKQQALEQIERDKYKSKNIVSELIYWHYGQVVAAFPSETNDQISKLINFNSITKYEPSMQVYTLSRIIQGLSITGDVKPRNDAIESLKQCETKERVLGSGLVGDTIKGSLNALEAMWPIIESDTRSASKINNTLDSLLCFYKKANTIGLLISIKNELDGCLKMLKQNGCSIRQEGDTYFAEHKDFHIIVKMGKAGFEAHESINILINKYDIKWLFVVGVAGSLGINSEKDPNEFIGPKHCDVVLATLLMPYELRVKDREKAENVGVPYQSCEWKVIPTDPTLFKIAHEENSELELDFKIYEGGVVTKNGINDLAEKKQEILTEWPGALAVEEEGHAAALICMKRGVHLLFVKGISDLAQGDKKEQNEDAENEKEVQTKAAENAMLVAINTIKKLSRHF